MSRPRSRPRSALVAGMLVPVLVLFLASPALSLVVPHQPPDADAGTFRSLYGRRLPEWLVGRLEDLGTPCPTAVQRASLDVLLPSGCDDAAAAPPPDAIVQSQTGSGKTLAYLLPLLAAVDPSRSAVQAVVAVPTRELGLQVGRVARTLAAGYAPAVTAEGGGARTHRDKLMVMSVLQGSENRRQRAWAWAESPQVVVGTPVELERMVSHGALRRNAIRTVVVDEADACLLAGGPGGTYDAASSRALHDLLSRHLSPTYRDGDDDADDGGAAAAGLAGSAGKNALGRPPPDRRTVFVSATIPQHRHFRKTCVRSGWTASLPVHVHVRPHEIMPASLTHRRVVCRSSADKLKALRALLRRDRAARHGAPRLERGLLFVDPARPLAEIARAVAKDLGGALFRTAAPDDPAAVVAVLRYGASLDERAAAMAYLAGDGDGVRLLLASDLAARGLDVPGVTHVYNLDVPLTSDGYLHRGGRAGRLGRPGTVSTVVAEDEEFTLGRIANVLGIEVECVGRQKGG